MTTLKIAPGFTLPLDAVTQTFAILAKKGSGKTYTASVIAEEMLNAKQRIVAIDPTGAWWGLRSTADGKHDAFSRVVVFGGDRGDVPINPAAGELVAQAVIEGGLSAVIDLSLLRKGESRRFVTDFLETVYRLNREPMHLFIDEADDVAPQRPMGDEARMLGAVEDVVKRGRRKGIGCTLITQRPADLNKQVLTQCEVLFALQIAHPKDLEPVMDWVRVHADPETAKTMLSDLPKMPRGEAWVWSPSWLDVFQRIKVRKRATFDSGATPTVGQKLVEPKRLAPVDVKALGAKIADLAEQASANDPAKLKKRIAELEAKLKQVPAVPKPTVDPEVIAELAESRRLIQAARDVETTLLSAAGTLGNLIEAHLGKWPRKPGPIRDAPIRISPPPAKSPAIQPVSSGLNSEVGRGGLRRILIALAQRPGLTNRQIGVRAGLSSGSGSFSTYLSKARSSGWIMDEGDRRFITDAGLSALGTYEPLPTGRALLEFWLSELGNSGAARILRALAEAHPRELSNEQIGQAAEISHSSGSFSTYMSKLRTLELIVSNRGTNRASDEFFGGTDS